ncbi:hypothetical protein L1987_62880 [Smallanthus sonchifolius]|uniref:Uncharacterized protein n=1 Tax=Smallanthus sonchifolius TaxID=185202 RepID=A0ACB9CBR4_9ASTR|nr:hypothetical protein L1987_62880 [Smallanthus sonchifolius]
MVECVESMLERWKPYGGKEIEVFEEFKHLTSDIISRTAFGSSYVEGKDIFQMLRKLTSILQEMHTRFNFPSSSQTRDNVESEMIERFIRKSFIDIVEKREKDSGGEVDWFGEDFLGSLMKAHHSVDDCYKVTMDDMIDEFETFYIAGHETTTGLLSWSMFLLAIHTDWQEKAREESFNLFKGKNPNSHDLSRMKFLLAIHTDWQEKAREESFNLFKGKNPNSHDLSRMKTDLSILIKE